MADELSHQSYRVETGVWVCPRCGWVDPETRATHCGGQAGRGHPPTLFEEVRRGEVAPGFHSDRVETNG